MMLKLKALSLALYILQKSCFFLLVTNLCLRYLESLGFRITFFLVPLDPLLRGGGDTSKNQFALTF